MTPSGLLIAIGIVAVLTGLGLLLCAVVAWRRSRQLGPEHPGVTAAGALPRSHRQRRQPRHRDGQVDEVPPGWMPLVGARKIRASFENRRRIFPTSKDTQ